MLVSYRRTLLSALCTLAAAPTISQAVVQPADPFGIALIALVGPGSAYNIIPQTSSTTFGATTTITGFDGQAITFTSSEVVGVTETTDTFTFSTPTNFLNEATLGGNTITSYELDIGTAITNKNPVDYLTPIQITGYTVDFGSSTAIDRSKLQLRQDYFGDNGGPTLEFNNTGLFAAEALTSSPTAITNFNINSFSLTVTYSVVPEPSSAMLLLGAGATRCLKRRRRA